MRFNAATVLVALASFAVSEPVSQALVRRAFPGCLTSVTACVNIPTQCVTLIPTILLDIDPFVTCLTNANVTNLGPCCDCLGSIVIVGDKLEEALEVAEVC